MIQKPNLFSRIAGISTIVLCAVGGLLYVKKPVQSVPAKPAPEEIRPLAKINRTGSSAHPTRKHNSCGMGRR
ncbi:hypothetical protein, partial [Microcoleus sp. C2D2]|uniref:hypothetical protein n=1 Tax=Microcoleus sp. C2D2 TaxID=3055326 RepID=UPI002FD71D97